MNTTDIAPRLRLRHGSWNALRSVIAGERVPRSELRELWDLNVLDGTALTDPAQELLEGLTGMAGVVHVLGSDAGALRSASVWVAADGVGLLDQIDGDYTILQRVERGIVPPSIVELLNLGPRPQLTEPESQTVPASLVNNVLEPSGDAAEPWTDLADAIEGRMSERAARTKHSERVREALGGPQSGIVIVDTVGAAIDVANAYGPEHLEIHTRHVNRDAKRIRNAGAIFVGPYTPVPLGDYLAGSNHVLPTGGTARFASGLNVHSFLKAVQEIEYTKEAAAGLYEPLRRMSADEDLPAHAEALQARID